MDSLNWVKFWPRIKKLHISRVLVESNPLVFSLSSTTLRIETLGGSHPHPLAKVAKYRKRARVKTLNGGQNADWKSSLSCVKGCRPILCSWYTYVFRKYLFEDSKYLAYLPAKLIRYCKFLIMLALLRHRYLRSKAYPGVVVTTPSVSCHACITNRAKIKRF